MAARVGASRRNRKIAAIAAGALVLGVGATYTLASWTDSEWVWGGADGDPGIGTSTFEVEQNTGTGWVQDEENPGNELVFSVGALALTPGDTTYAPVSLRTVAGSIAGDLTLQGAVAASGITVVDAGGLLWDAVEVSVYTNGDATAPACTPADFDDTEWTELVADAPIGTGAAAAQSLLANAGSTQNYCFLVTLPADADETLMGRTIAPAWEFAAVSE